MKQENVCIVHNVKVSLYQLPYIPTYFYFIFQTNHQNHNNSFYQKVHVVHVIRGHIVEMIPKYCAMLVRSMPQLAVFQSVPANRVAQAIIPQLVRPVVQFVQ